MPHATSNRSKAAAAAGLALVLASLVLAACGSSSTSTSSTASASASASTSTSGAPTGASGPRGGRFAAIRECLQKAGITLPKRTPGQPGGGLLGGGAGATLPKGVTRAQYTAALRKCGGGVFTGGGLRFQGTAFRQALAKFASCMRANGVNVPAPNASGKGPIFSTKGLNPTSATFKAAEAKCGADLRGILRPGARSGGPSTGAPTSPGGATQGSG